MYLSVVLVLLQVANYKIMLVQMERPLFMTLTQLHLVDTIKGKTKGKVRGIWYPYLYSRS